MLPLVSMHLQVMIPDHAFQERTSPVQAVPVSLGREEVSLQLHQNTLSGSFKVCY